MRPRRAAALAGLLAALVLTGCSDPEAGFVPNPPDIDVDTPALREAKAEAGIEDCAPGDGEPVDGGLPAVTLPCLGGGPDVDLAALRGPMVVNLWASWCGPCRREMPVLQEFHATHGDTVPVLGVDFQDPNTGLALQQLAQRGVTYPSVADTEAVLKAEPLRATALPLTALVDENGVVVRVLPVELETVEELEALVREHLGVDL
ncbi:TlpA disulfide reductase family protein [uncultured Nocardioides sp.]|uniref:TlpA disulfide reductase family protein n=1 Tax=uncultured Nocardioides sp. TaxID=198441 RepID=UPI00262CE660|nr:TlpA disulfide reductase family protein [uncultured Nocardioides sp.]